MSALYSYNDAKTRRWHRITGRQERWDEETQEWEHVEGEGAHSATLRARRARRKKRVT